jgi:hypothetical protein
VVASIDHAARIVPRGSFRKVCALLLLVSQPYPPAAPQAKPGVGVGLQAPSGSIEPCHTFAGLSVEDGGKLDNYLHCRPAVTLGQKTAVEKVRHLPACFPAHTSL